MARSISSGVADRYSGARCSPETGFTPRPQGSLPLEREYPMNEVPRSVVSIIAGKLYTMNPFCQRVVWSLRQGETNGIRNEESS